jgi:N-acyl-D-aspartate/D-glutamate deacylase
VEIAGARIGHVGVLGRSPGVDTHDLDGLVLAPGFLDLHTHYDAQVFWEPSLSASAWHGVTTVVTGNCGFTIAPTRPDPAARHAVVHLLRAVEGMSAAVLEAGLPWCFETFPEYLDALRALPLGLNVAALVGHDSLRRYVMGSDAQDRAATPEERAELRAVAADAAHAGAIGFSTDRSGHHWDASGRAVPSMYADRDEVVGIAEAVAAAGGALVELACGEEFDLDLIGDLSVRTGVGVTPSGVLTGLHPRPRIDAILEASGREGRGFVPQISCRPRLHYLTLGVPYEFLRMSEAFGAALELDHGELAALYRDPSWRAAAVARMTPRGEKLLRTASVAETSRHPELVGTPLTTIARQRHVAEFDALVDLSLEDHLATRFVYSMFNDEEDAVGELLRDRRGVLGLSDAGAHSDRVFDANFPTYLLGHWVRERGALSLSFAVWRLTGQVADLLGLADRGRVVPGHAADLVAFDPDTVGCTRVERVFDLPAGGDRLVSRSLGIEHVWVNGVATRRDGADLPAAPGVVLGDRPRRR